MGSRISDAGRKAALRWRPSQREREREVMVCKGGRLAFHDNEGSGLAEQHERKMRFDLDLLQPNPTTTIRYHNGDWARGLADDYCRISQVAEDRGNKKSSSNRCGT